MAIVAYTGTAPVAGSLITVYDGGTIDLATIYADVLLTPLGNPFTADPVTGLYQYFAEEAQYDVILAMPDLPPTSITLPGIAPTVVFAGVSPNRTATLIATDPDTDQVIILAQTRY